MLTSPQNVSGLVLPNSLVDLMDREEEVEEREETKAEFDLDDYSESEGE